MRKFEGNINGKVYTDEKEFSNAILEVDDSGDMYVSYKYISVPDIKDESKIVEDNIDKDSDIFVGESQYIKTIINKSELDEDLIDKLKIASNKSDIYRNVCNKIEDFDSRIEDNLLHINELKSDYKKLDEKIKLINSQIKTLDDANNNYYLQKEYYTNIKKLVTDNISVETKKEKDNEDSTCECKCDDNKEIISLKKIYDMTPQELAKYLNKKNIYDLAELVEYFLKKC